MRRTEVDPRFDFEVINRAIGRWRADKAPCLSRDEAVRHILGEWLDREGYIKPVAVDRPTGDWIVAVISQRKLSGQ